MPTAAFRNISDVALAPVYDCGSCLYPQADEKIMRSVIQYSAERDLRVFERPLSGIKIGEQKINYFRFISSLENQDCNRALRRIVPQIDMNKIIAIVNDTPYVSDLQKEFYITILRERKEKFLDFSLLKLTSVMAEANIDKDDGNSYNRQ